MKTYTLVICLVFSCNPIESASNYMLADPSKCFSDIFQLLCDSVNDVLFVHSMAKNNSRRSLNNQFPVYVSKSLRQLSATSNLSFMVFDDAIKPIVPDEQTDNVDCDVVVIWFEKFDEGFSPLFKSVKTMRFTGSETKLLIVVENAQFFGDSDMNSCFEAAWKNFQLLNTVLMVIKSTIDFYAFGYHNSTFSYSKANSWSGSFSNTKCVFCAPEPLMLAYPLKAAFDSSAPYIFLSDYGNMKEEPTEGVEVKTILTVAKHYKWPIKFFRCPPVEACRVSILNGSYNGLLRFLESHSADIIFAGITVLPERSAVGTAIPATIHDQLIWFTPAPSPNGTNWQALEGGIPVDAWIFIFTVILLSTVVAFLKIKVAREKYKTFSSVLLNVFGVNIDHGFTTQKHLDYFRSLFSLLLVYSIIVTTCYKSGVVTELTSPKPPKSIQTILEALDAGLEFKLLPSSQWIIESLEKRTYEKIFREGNVEITKNTGKIFESIAIKRQSISIYPKNYVSFVINARYQMLGGESLISYVPDNPVAFPIYMYMSAGNPRTTKFSQKVQELLEGGLTEKWLEDYRFISNLKTRLALKSDNRPAKLSLSKLSTVFFIFCFCLTVTIFSFLLEVLHFFGKKWLFCKKCSRF